MRDVLFAAHALAPATPLQRVLSTSTCGDAAALLSGDPPIVEEIVAARGR